MRKVFMFLMVLGACAACQREPEKVVKISTTEGDIKVKLYNETPLHRDNFIKLVQEKFYDGVLFHRVIKDFMIQAGDPDSKNATPEARLGEGDLGYRVKAEIRPELFHKKGVLAAARQGDAVNPNRESSASQFYIAQGRSYSSGDLKLLEERINTSRKAALYNRIKTTFADQYKALQEANDAKGVEALTAKMTRLCDSLFVGEQLKLTRAQRSAYTSEGGIPHLDGQYTVFGEVIEGLDVLDKIAAVKTDSYDRPLKDVKIKTMTLEE